MKSLLKLLPLLAALYGCAYGDVTADEDGKEVVITRNTCLGGLMRKVYACNVSKDGGLEGCKETTAP